MVRHWTDRLSEYIDGELDAQTRAQVDAHIAQCTECASTLRELQSVVTRAGSLPAYPPAKDLWTGIAARIASEPTDVPVVDLQEFAQKKQRRFSFSVPQLVAAGVALMLLSGGTVWLTLSSVQRAQPGAQSPRAVAAAPAQPSDSGSKVTVPARLATSNEVTPEAVRGSANEQPAAGTQVERAAPEMRVTAVRNAGRTTNAASEKHYADAVSDLETILKDNRSKLDPKTVRILEDNLRLIDRAIADARKALVRDSANVYLNEHLAENMQRKLDLLRRATAIVNAQS